MFRGSSVSVFTNKVVSGVMFTNKDVGFGGNRAFRGLFGLSDVSGIVCFFFYRCLGIASMTIIDI